MSQNSLIQELSEKAKDSIPKDKFTVNDWIKVYNEKFAELIIRECMTNLYLNGYDDAMKQIKEHFGVRE